MDLEYLYKHFVSFLIGLIFITFNLIFQPANAKDLTYLSKLQYKNSPKFNNLSLGADFVYLTVNNKGDYNDIFKKNRAGLNFYVGYNLNGIMLEAGYSFTTRRAKEITIPAGQTFLGLPVSTDTLFTGKVRFKNTHLTLNFFSNFYENLQVITAIGMGFVRPHTIFDCIDVAAGTPSDYTGRIASKTTLVPKLGIGFNVIHSSKLSFRSMFYVEQYSKIRYKLAPVPEQSKPFKNAYTVLFGFLYKI